MSRRYLVRLKPEVNAIEKALALAPQADLLRAVPVQYFTHADGRPNPLLPYVILEIEDLVALDGKVLNDG